MALAGHVLVHFLRGKVVPVGEEVAFGDGTVGFGLVGGNALVCNEWNMRVTLEGWGWRTIP